MVGRGVFYKKGISPVIASVLLILLVLILASIIFLWARGFLSEQVEKKGKPIEVMCDSIDIRADLVLPSGNQKAYLEVVNRGDVDVFNLEIRKHLEGNIEIARFPFQVSSGAAVTQEISLLMKDGSTPEKIVVYPSLVGVVRGKNLNKAVSCMDRGIEIQIS